MLRLAQHHHHHHPPRKKTSHSLRPHSTSNNVGQMPTGQLWRLFRRRILECTGQKTELERYSQDQFKPLWSGGKGMKIDTPSSRVSRRLTALSLPLSLLSGVFPLKVFWSIGSALVSSKHMLTCCCSLIKTWFNEPAFWLS